MKVTRKTVPQPPPPFEPVVITLETRDEVQALQNIIGPAPFEPFGSLLYSDVVKATGVGDRAPYRFIKESRSK